MKKTKTPVEPTFEERAAAAHAKAGAALSVFELAANDLQQAAVEKAALQSDIDTEIGRLLSQVEALEEQLDNAEVAEAEFLAKAEAIRSLVGIN